MAAFPVLSQAGTSSLPGAMATEWSIPTAEKAKYDLIFDGLQPVNGMLTGDKVKPVLLNSNLPVDVLGRVWDLSDIDADGLLDRDEFTLAMHLVYRALERNPVPVTLPPDMIPPSKRKHGGGLAGAVAVLPGTATALPTPAASGPVVPDAAVPLVPASTTVPVSTAGRASPASMTGGKWVVTAAEKAQYDDMFTRADTDRDGFVNGAEIKDIFLQSGLPQMVLAHIWGLCDTKTAGKLNSDQFALAMHLVQQKLKGVDPPAVLSPDMIPPSLRTFTFPDGSAAAPMVSVDTAGLKELDLLSRDIDDLKREKMKLEQDKTQKEADIKIKNGEVLALQKELDAVSNTVKQLEMQKAEAQKRLDELDDKKLKLENSLKECKEKYAEEQSQIKELQYQITHRESIATNQEAEMKRMRDELTELRQEEIELEQKVDTSRSQVAQLDKRLVDTQSQISQVKLNIQKLRDTQKSLSQSVSQYNASLNNDMTEEHLRTTPAAGSDFPQVSATSGFDDFKADPFVAKDPFANEVAQADDPFHSHDPFAGSSDPFANDPFANSSSVDPFGGDPFDDAFKGSTTESSAFGVDLPPKTRDKGADPWGTFSATSSAVSDLDKFDPFAAEPAATSKSPVNSSDPFGTGLFIPAGGTSVLHLPSRSMTASEPPQLPPKQHKRAPAPPRPPAPKPAGGSVPGGLDTYDSNDPFAKSQRSGLSSSSSQKNDAFANFAEFSPARRSPLLSEADQLAWATKDSTQEWQRLQRLQQQEQADLELALARSRQET